MGVILPGVERDFPPVFFVGLGREEIKVCDAFWETGDEAPGLMRHLA